MNLYFMIAYCQSQQIWESVLTNRLTPNTQFRQPGYPLTVITTPPIPYPLNCCLRPVSTSKVQGTKSDATGAMVLLSSGMREMSRGWNTLGKSLLIKNILFQIILKKNHAHRIYTPAIGGTRDVDLCSR